MTICGLSWPKKVQRTVETLCSEQQQQMLHRQAGQMDAVRINFLLLLLCFAWHLDSEGTIVKTIRKESYFTPICINKTSNIIMMIVCKIRTERNNGEECNLLYQDGGDFVHECDSRFSLKTRNQTVFLHLTSLTAADSGNYSCQCSNLNGTHFLHLSITVNESNPDNNPADEVWSQSAAVTLSSALTAAVLMIMVSVILGFIYRRRSHRGQPESCRDDLEEDLTEIEPYSSYTQKENSLYSTATSHSCQINSDYANIFS
ncbi:uncharacterized protein LOC129355481 isoform X1 [Poeciliopsis prolifica]|uniref:uncharacterized protein LOC129355481 isoform X1 n=1 Tax=Poeciliopsis prolifica TaxID=188132 RepID=UPI002414416C|nr:uncharacterized protein LOC129355481 isoform X1 [Poeciliopsis prolifica]